MAGWDPKKGWNRLSPLKKGLAIAAFSAAASAGAFHYLTASNQQPSSLLPEDSYTNNYDYGNIYQNKSYIQSAEQTEYISYQKAEERAANGLVKHADITQGGGMAGAMITGEQTNGIRFRAVVPIGENAYETFKGHGVNVEVVELPKPQQQVIVTGGGGGGGGSWMQYAILAMFGIMAFTSIANYRNQKKMMNGGAGGASSFGKSNAQKFNPEDVTVTFDDVAGIEEAKEEVAELVEFLRDPQKFQRLGGKLPRGVLMYGSPGTGKTLLAKAIAGEAKVPFFSVSGSEFVEMFVGVGASRVRNLFEQAKKHSPCIVFIDEIDALGAARGDGGGGSHREQEQTLNQLLTAMDGFEQNESIIVMGATNRPDNLDKALLRPGRFDRQVVVPLPDVGGREKILEVHMKKVPLADDVDASIIARGTQGFSGADLANVVNEAAIYAAKSDKDLVDMNDFNFARDKVIMGAERKSLIMSDQEKKITAYHEAGHAIVGYYTKGADTVHKISIIPRGRALGVTMFLPDEDRLSHDVEYLNAQIDGLYGGRAAEELIFGKDKITTGASNDIERLTDIAESMIKRWGLSEELPIRNYAGNAGNNYLGMSFGSKAAPAPVEQEIDKKLEASYDRVKELLEGHKEELHNLANALLKYEALHTTGEIEKAMRGEDLNLPPEDPRSPDHHSKPSKKGSAAVAPLPPPSSREKTTFSGRDFHL